MTKDEFLKELSSIKESLTVKRPVDEEILRLMDLCTSCPSITKDYLGQNRREGILGNAEFGKMYLCKNGMRAVVISISENSVCCGIEDGTIESHYDFDGTIYQYEAEEYHIVSELN